MRETVPLVEFATHTAPGPRAMPADPFPAGIDRVIAADFRSIIPMESAPIAPRPFGPLPRRVSAMGTSAAATSATMTPAITPLRPATSDLGKCRREIGRLEGANGARRSAGSAPSGRTLTTGTGAASPLR